MILFCAAYARDAEKPMPYLDKLLGKPQIPEELWEEDVQKLLQNPAKLKNYPFEMTEEILKKYLNKWEPVWGENWYDTKVDWKVK